MKHTCRFPLEAPMAKRLLELANEMELKLKKAKALSTLRDYTTKQHDLIMNKIASGKHIEVRTTQIF